ncbi:DUF6338 family protein [Proteus terrae]|uniref:DUF6338 family protein n=3 Tax=Proteus terrae TaxID=1574161 RepID=UPI000D698BC9|nr:DUF6338 family protein [Proteus terrae]
MDIWEVNKLILFITFVIPGFLSMKIYSILQPNVRLDMTKYFIDIISYSCINYGIWVLPIYFIQNSNLYYNCFILYLFFYLVVLFISPIFLVVILVWIRSWRWLSRLLPHPTGRAWDYFFRLGHTCWVIVTLKNSEKIAGKFSINSFASSSPEPEQLYLEEHWVLNDDGGFERPRVETLGILILSSEIESIEFFKFTEIN